MFIKFTICNVHCSVLIIFKIYIREYFMVTYLKSSEKHAFDKLKFYFKLYSNIVVPNWVDFD